MQVGLGIALGAGIGAAIAVILGSGGAWLAIGIAVGIVIGSGNVETKSRACPSLPNSSSPLEAVRNDKSLGLGESSGAILRKFTKGAHPFLVLGLS